MSSQQKQEVALIGETTTFTRMGSKEGEMLEVKIHTRARTSVGVGHESIQSVVIGADQAKTLIAGLQMLQSQVQAVVAAEVTRQAEAEASDAAAAAGDQSPQSDAPAND